MYIVEKEAGFLHGVFWIGSDLEEAKKKANEFSALGSNDHLIWAVRYAYYMWLMTKDVRFSVDLAGVAYIEYAGWEEDTPKFAVSEEISRWYIPPSF